MDLKSTKGSPVLADPAPINKSRLGIHSSLLPCSQSGQSFSTAVPSIPRKKPGKLDDVCSNGWLDAMKSSSPPRKKVLKDFNFADLVPDDGETAYESWKVNAILYQFTNSMAYDNFNNGLFIPFLILTFLNVLFVSTSQIRYPSALNSFRTISTRARNRKIVVFLDYDGTLSPIVDDPDRAFMSDDVRIYLAFDYCLIIPCFCPIV